jgi:aldose sugar dehydrogenase
MNPSRRASLQTAAGFAAGTLLGSSKAQTASNPVPPTGPAPRLREIANGLENPWAVAFLPDGQYLVTERPGRMRLISAAGKVSTPLEGVPRVLASGQGGLLDVVLSPEFARDNTVFFAYSQPTNGGARTAVARAELQGNSLRNLQVIFAQRQDPSGGYHFGARIVFGRDGNLWITLGDRYFQKDRAQDLSSHFGKVVRIRPNGSVPPDNPYVNTPNALPEIWSIGHRNLQGAVLHPATGKLWTHEHGAQGGDELNIPEPGKNYGWPVITWGVDYGGGKIGEGTNKPGLEQPVHYWVPSIAPSGMCFLTSDRYQAQWPGWKNSLFIGSLKFRQLVRLELDGQRVMREERFSFTPSERIRDVRQGNDGLLYVLTDASDGKLLRVEAA